MTKRPPLKFDHFDGLRACSNHVDRALMQVTSGIRDFYVWVARDFDESVFRRVQLGNFEEAVMLALDFEHR